VNPLRTMRLLTRVLLAAAVLVAAGAALDWVAQRPRFDIRRIEVTGDLRHVSRAAIRAAIAGHLRGTFFTMRLAETRAAFESVPWIASASVRRVWPDRLVVHMIERRAIGLWSDGRVLSDAGVLFEANPEEAELDGPQVDFSGPPALAPEAAQRLAEFRTALTALGQEPVAVQISDRDSWTVRTASGQSLALGRDDPAGSVSARLDAVVASYATVVAQLNGPPGRIDARYSNGFAAVKP
jgi:cell division protein FtsQ